MVAVHAGDARGRRDILRHAVVCARWHGHGRGHGAPLCPLPPQSVCRTTSSASAA
jgi:hypothetical protein